MNAPDFNNKLNTLIDETIKDGIAAGKMSFETAIGIMEVHQQGLMDMRKHVAMQRAVAQQPQIIQPGVGPAPTNKPPFC